MRLPKYIGLSALVLTLMLVISYSALRWVNSLPEPVECWETSFKSMIVEGLPPEYKHSYGKGVLGDGFLESLAQIQGHDPVTTAGCRIRWHLFPNGA